MLSSPQSKKKRSRSLKSPSKPRRHKSLAKKSFDSKDPRPYFTYLESPFCIFCKRTSPPLIKLPSGIFINLTGHVHEICLKTRGCCECGVLGLCYRCTYKDCQRLIHSWCAAYIHSNSNFCDLHFSMAKKKEASKNPYIKAISRKVITSGLWEKDYKDKDSPTSLCNGYIFWYLIGMEYFPGELDLTCFPSFPLCTQFELEYEPVVTGDFVEESIERVKRKLDSVVKRNEELICGTLELVRMRTGIDKVQKGVDCDGYIDLMEKIPTADKNSISLSSGLRHDTSPSSQINDALCQICKMNEEQDSLVTCFKCSLTVHQKCYRTNQTQSFKCDECEFPDLTSPCILCSKSEGILRKTVHSASEPLLKDLTKSKEIKNWIWVHCFCALHTPGVSFRASLIDLSALDISKSSTRCEVCKSNEGVCINCSFSNCNKYFHPECGRDLFVSNKSNEKKIFCDLHKPVKLRKMLENRQKQLTEDLMRFCKSMEKYLDKARPVVKIIKKKKVLKPKPSQSKIFSPEEDFLLEYRIQQFLYRLNLSQKDPFELVINLEGTTRCSKVGISRPQYFTLVSPGVIIEENISIDYRTAEECFKRYQDTLFNKIRNEMLLLGKRIFLYQGLELPAPKHYTRPKKRKQQGPQKSLDTYCVCNKPFYYEIPWIADWTQEQWEEKIRENEMIECTKCEKWFHLQCVGYHGSLDKARQDDNWKCESCEIRRDLVSSSEKQVSIQDKKSGMTTRRGLKIQ